MVSERLTCGRYQRDDRTDHESREVISGPSKYGVNVWIHMYPYRKFKRSACDNVAYVDNWY